MADKSPPTPGRIVQFCLSRPPWDTTGEAAEWRPFHVTDAKLDEYDGAVFVTGWVLLSPDDVGCDEHGVIPPGTPPSPWRPYRNVPEGIEPGRWRWPPRV